MKEINKFKCENCHSRFGQKSHFNQHVALVHEGKKKIKCEICKANFGHKGDLNIHVTTVHEGKKQLKCGICNAAFGVKRYSEETCCYNP